MKNTPIVCLYILPLGMKRVRVDVSEYVLSLRYEDVDDKADKLTVTIDNDDLSNFDEPLFRAGNGMLVSWGYPDIMTVERLMKISKVSGFRSLTLEALGGEVALDKIERLEAWKNVKRSDVARIIAERWGYRAPNFQWIDDTEVVFPQITQPKMTDGQLLRKLAREQGFVWYIQQDGFHFHKRRDADPPIRTFRYYADQPDPEISAILDISIEIDVTRRGGVQMRGYETLERFGIKLDGTEITEDERRGFAVIKEARGQEALGTPLQETATIGIERTNATTRAELKQNTAKALDDSMKESVKMSLTIIGDPNIYAKTKIAVEGIGKRLSQDYYVKSVTHNIGSGYTCQLECLSDGSKGVLETSKFVSGSMVVDMKGPPSKARPKKREDPDRPGIKSADPEWRKQRDAKLDRIVKEVLGAPAGAKTPINQPEIDVEDLMTNPNQTNINNPPPPEPPPEPPPAPVDESSLIGGDKSAQLAPGAKGRLFEGNVDLRNRPYVRNQDGSYSTIRSMSITGDDGFTYLIPTVSDDGRIMSDQEAVRTFESRGKHLGIYGSVREAEVASQELHADQINNPPNNTLGPTPRMGYGSEAVVQEDSPPVVPAKPTKTATPAPAPDPAPLPPSG